MKLVFDLDGVLCLIDQLILEECNQRNLLLGKTTADYHTYNLIEAFPELSEAVLLEILDSRDFYLRAGCCQYLLQALQDAAKRDDEVHLVTARPQSKRDDTVAFMLQHGVPYHVLEHVPSKLKADYAQELGADCVVEDHPLTAQACTHRGILTVLVAAPYNQSVPANLFLRRMDRTQVPNFLRDQAARNPLRILHGPTEPASAASMAIS